ncbi:MAG: hypothetical protein IPP72_02095 [Chitinophagaceae bacterium]|nr:hypothetical protein [Chitinophagaceae bacterium]
MNKNLQVFLAVLAGIITMYLLGLILFPALKWVIIKNLHLFEASSILNKLAIDGAGFLWIGISSFCGGYIAALAAPYRNIFYSLITGIVSFVLVICFAFYQQSGFSLVGLLSGFEVIIFSLIGGIIQQKIALRKYEAI